MDARERRRTLWIALGLVLAVFALYWPVRAHDFVSYDDDVYLTDNPHVRQGLAWSEVRWVLTHDHAANYHPLTWLSHMLDVELFGFEPAGHHLMNVGLHALNAVLVLLLGRALLGGLGAATLGAALFALHPLRVESVAWASERKDVLCALFFLAGLLLHLRYGRAPSLPRYLLMALAFLLALAAKPMAVTFPCVVLLLDLWPLGRLERARPWLPAPDASGRRSPRVFLEKLPLLALAALGAVTTWIAQEVGGAVNVRYAPPLGLRLLNALASTGTYLAETLWPARLSVFHPLAAALSKEPARELLAPAALSAVVLVGVSALAWRRRERWPWMLVGLAWFLGMLVPVIGLKQVGAQAHADRYTYLPLLGVAWIVAGLAQALAARGPRARAVTLATSGIAVLALALAARAQLGVWRDTETLFSHALEVEPRNYVAHAALGAWSLQQGDPERAREHVEAALAIYPLDGASLTTLGRLDYEAGDLEAAEASLRRAMKLQPSKWVHYQLAKVRLARGDREEAAREFAAALALDPSLVDAHFNLGQVLFGLGRREAARGEFEAALALDPEHAGAWNGMGVLALEAGDALEAERRFARASALDPEYADALNNLGVALERQGKKAEARARFAEARALVERQRARR